MNEQEPTKKQILDGEFGLKLINLANWAIIEDIIDPTKGTEFTLMQSQPSDLPAVFETLQHTASRASRVATFVIPDPIEHHFQEQTMTDQDRATRIHQVDQELKRLDDKLTDLEEERGGEEPGE